LGVLGGKDFRVRLSFLGEFVDKELEKEFAGHEAMHSVRLARPSVLLLGILYFSFAVSDTFLTANRHTFNLLLLNRALFLFVSILFHVWLKKGRSINELFLSVTLYEIIGAGFIMHVFLNYEAPNFLIQTFNIMIVLIVVYIMPNRWGYKVLVSLIISIGFFWICFRIFPQVGSREFTASITNTAIVIVLSAISSFQINRHKRIQFANNKELTRLSSRDSLTGIYNRHRFEEELHRYIRHIHRYGGQLSLILFDIDDFKRINDSFGHAVGDKIIVNVTELVKLMIRETDFFSRWGGEEFAVILPDTDKEDATRLAHRLRTRICCTYFEPVGQITCSFGIDSFKPGDNIDTLMKRVDKFMYMAKEAGKDQVINAF